MNTPKAKQLWLWMGEDLVYLQAKLRTDKYGSVTWRWLDLNKGVCFVSQLSVPHVGWELLVDV